MFYLEVSKVQNSMRKSIDRKKMRISQISIKVKEVIEECIRVITVEPLKKRKSVAIKQEAFELETFRSIAPVQYDNHIRFHLLQRERKYMLEFIKWNILVNKTMLNPNLISETLQNIKQAKEEEKWINKELKENSYFLKFKPFFTQYLTEMEKRDKRKGKKKKEEESQDVKLIGYKEKQETKEEKVSSFFLSLFTKSKSMENIEEEDPKSQVICELLNIKMADLKNPDFTMKRPFLQFMPDRKEAIDLIMRMYCVKKEFVLDSPRKKLSDLTWQL